MPNNDEPQPPINDNSSKLAFVTDCGLSSGGTQTVIAIIPSINSGFNTNHKYICMSVVKSLKQAFGYLLFPLLQFKLISPRYYQKEKTKLLPIWQMQKEINKMS